MAGVCNILRDSWLAAMHRPPRRLKKRLPHDTPRPARHDRADTDVMRRMRAKFILR